MVGNQKMSDVKFNLKPVYKKNISTNKFQIKSCNRNSATNQNKGLDKNRSPRMENQIRSGTSMVGGRRAEN